MTAPSFGRTATLSDNQHLSSTVGFSGGAAASGVWIIAVAACCFDGSAPLSISGGTTWTEINTGSTLVRCWVHLCGGSEPTTYTVTYDNLNNSSDNGLAFVMSEVLNADSTNPDDHQVVSASGTCPSATSTDANDLAVICVGEADSSVANYTTPPSGYTQQGRITTTYSGILHKLIAAIAGKASAGSGTISPGSWTPTGTPTNQKIWTVLFKPVAAASGTPLLFDQEANGGFNDLGM